MLKPFQEFILWKNFLIVAHGNYLSYYDVDKQQWKWHHKFEEISSTSSLADDQTMVSANHSNAYLLKKQVMKVFRTETTFDADSAGIGVLFQDGSFERLHFEIEDGSSRVFLKKLGHNVKVDGRIISFAQDKEHSRILYILTESRNGEIKVWGYSKEKLYDLTSAMEVTADCKIIPYFAPADETQMIVLYPSQNKLRIYQHSTIIDEEGVERINMERKKKIY